MEINLPSKIIISDPCYKKIDSSSNHDLECLPGNFRIIVNTEKDRMFNNTIVTGVNLYHTTHDGSVDKELLLKCDVDSGQLGVFPKDKYDPSNNEWYELMCGLTLEKPYYGIISDCFVTSSGYGDGTYDVYLKLFENKVVEIRINFVYDEEPEYEYFDDDDYDSDGY